MAPGRPAGAAGWARQAGMVPGGRTDASDRHAAPAARVEQTRAFRPCFRYASIGRRPHGLPECAADWGRSALRVPDAMRRAFGAGWGVELRCSGLGAHGRALQAKPARDRSAGLMMTA